MHELEKQQSKCLPTPFSSSSCFLLSPFSCVSVINSWNFNYFIWTFCTKTNIMHVLNRSKGEADGTCSVVRIRNCQRLPQPSYNNIIPYQSLSSSRVLVLSIPFVATWYLLMAQTYKLIVNMVANHINVAQLRWMSFIF